MVPRYYRALHDGDLPALRQMMAPASYRMTLEAYGLRRSFADADFKALLKRIDADEGALAEVEKVVAEMLRAQGALPKIGQLQTEPLGADRCAVRYTEDGVNKKLSFSKTDRSWRIDYYAGRKRD
jgi:hypothetical protein